MNTADAVNAANARHAGSWRRCGSHSDARPVIAGRTPIPIANAEPAWNPRLHMRCLHACVTTAYSGERALTIWFSDDQGAEARIPAPMWSSTLQPARSRRLVGPAAKSTIAART